MTQQEIAVILENHQHWLLENCENWQDMRANLQDACLCGVNLRGANLCDADLCCVNLRGANSCDANLCGANLFGADLRNADLCGADLRDADLRYAYLRGANLCCADLYGAKNIPFIPFTCPDKGAFTGWKKCRNDYIVELLIPSEAKRLSSTGRKCRCNKAIVVSIQNIDGSIANVKTVCSQYDEKFFYTVGEAVSVDNFCEDRWRECSAGIHFFVNRQEAVDYE